QNPTADPANVAQALVYTLLNVFDATRDLYETLRNKEKRDYQENLRSKGYPSSRRIEYVDGDGADGEEAIVMDKAAVTRQFEIGFQDVGAQYAVGDASASTALVKSRHDSHAQDDRYSAQTTILDLQSRPKATRTDTESTAFSGPTSYGTETAPHSLFCLYALDLQRHPSQTLAASLTSDPNPYCPYCKRVLHLSAGKSWEIFKDDEGTERCFRVQNRFVIKCHRESADGGYSCILCSRADAGETVCGDVKALIRHVWMDHDVGELELEEDVGELVEKVHSQRRDSGMSFSESRGSRRSASLGPSRRGRRKFEREVDSLVVRPPPLRDT
ncbi:hypothetical protein BDV95DRAFT_643736, partial [Massariosphaeria phaeospora]